jgi:transcription factor E2F4/5
MSAAGPIDVLLINKDPVNSTPVVLPVPPPEEMLQNTKSAAASVDTTTHTFVKTTRSLTTGKPKAHTAAKPSGDLTVISLMVYESVLSAKLSIQYH